jgi:protoheme IX farnesyltransferase
MAIIKPGIIFGNLISVIGGFLLASGGVVDYPLFLSVMSGVSLVVASGCVLNNLIDSDIDGKMDRTRNRPLVRGVITPKSCMLYAIFLGMMGILLLYLNTNIISVSLAIVGLIVYVGIYSLYMKRKSVYGTMVGSISGATPPVIGYCSVTNQFDTAAIILLAVFSIWQMPHSYAIAIFRLEDYRKANIPVFPLVKGNKVARRHIVFYIALFIFATMTLVIAGYTNYSYFFIMSIMGLWWLKVALSKYDISNEKLWARRVFVTSIFTITILSITMAVSSTGSDRVCLTKVVDALVVHS